jgi:hypothetical protein
MEGKHKKWVVVKNRDFQASYAHGCTGGFVNVVKKTG